MIYAELNGTMQQIGGNKPDGWVIMTSPRPDGDYVAGANGEWVLTITPLQKAKEDKILEINLARDTEEQGGFEYLGGIFDSDSISVQRLTSASISASLALSQGQNFSVYWTLQDNGIKELTAQELVLIIPALTDFADTIHTKAATLKVQVQAATTVEEVEAIVW